MRTLEKLLLRLAPLSTIGERLSTFSLLGALYVTLLPIVLVHHLLIDTWQAGKPRAWDGTGHYGVAQIYAQSIFPDTFGWTNGFFGGMPFPNFYPPLFFWFVAFLNKTGLPLLTAFKLVAVVPLLLVPVFVWLLAWSATNRDRTVSFWAAMLSVFPLTSPAFGGQQIWASGLDFFSTLAIGLYTQPLGFILLLAWFAAYIHAHRRVWLFVAATLLLAIAVLTSFLNGISSVVIVAGVLLFDLIRYFRRRKAEENLLRPIVAHTLSPILSAGLALFWLVPMLNSYSYFVTRPFTTVIFTRNMIVWFVIAAIGFVFWRFECTQARSPYTFVCVTLGLILAFSAWAAPHWLPLQANRFSPILYFLLAIPVSYALVGACRLALKLADRFTPLVRRATDALVPLALFVFLLVLPFYFYDATTRSVPTFFHNYQAKLSFYPPAGSIVNTVATPTPTPPPGSPTTSQLLAVLTETRPSDLKGQQIFDALKAEHAKDDELLNNAAATLENILAYAREHRDGRYLVEIPAQYRTDAATFDARALNSYLGAQGNQSLIVVFREASPNSIFLYPQVGALSHNPDNFGFSSVLADDLEFAQQPLAKHLERLSYLGTRYFVINSDKIKERLSQEPMIGGRFDFGTWSVFQLKDPPQPLVRSLPYRPALVVSGFTLKGRRSDESSYIRFAEEQFADGWFDVVLAKAPSTQLDDLGTMEELNQFGAIILDTYDCDRCDLVYRQLKSFAQTKPLILLMDDRPLFNRLRFSMADLPKATIIERDAEPYPGHWLDSTGATSHYDSSPARTQWKQIRAILESNKVPSTPATVTGQVGQNTIQINYAPSQPLGDSGEPVLVATSYHPNWQAQKSEVIYAADPMFMLVFVHDSTSLAFKRTSLDRMAAWGSALTLTGLLGFALFHGIRRRRRRALKEDDSRAKTPRRKGRR